MHPFAVCEAKQWKKLNINHFCLYRPPPSVNNQLTNSRFFSKCAFLLHLYNTLSISSIISGDLNAHIDIRINLLVQNINNVLTCKVFYHAVNVHHKLGHTLDQWFPTFFTSRHTTELFKFSRHTYHRKWYIFYS